MQIRLSLRPAPLDEQLVQMLTNLAEDIVALMNVGADPEPLIAEFNAKTGQVFDRGDFHCAWEGSGTRVLVETALHPAPQRVPDITDDELLEIITYLVDGHGSESEQTYWITFLERNLPHPGIVNLIYWGSDDATPAQILTAAKAYKPILL